MSTIFKNCRFFTPRHATSATPFDGDPQCMIVENGLINYLGRDSGSAIEKARRANALEIDLKGQLVAPGFIDSHCHISALGAALDKLDLRYCKNLDEIRAEISDYASKHPSASMILCRGWIQNVTGGTAAAAMLDGLDSRPIFIEANDLHSAWCNAAALEALALDKTPDPKGGRIHRDESGKPTGLLDESAVIELVWPFLAQSTSRDERTKNILRAIDAYSSSGYTGLIEMAMGEEDWEILRELSSQGRLKCWVRAHWLIKPREKIEDCIAQVDRATELSRQSDGGTFPGVQVVGIKLICDGVVDSCTASLMEPYTVDGSSCDPIWSEEMLAPVVKHADSAGLQCACHAIGDRTIKMVVDVIERCATPGRRHRIEHLEVTRPEDARRLGQLGITASVQPVHSDPAILAGWPKLVGDRRCLRAFAYKEFADHGATLAFGTDAPTAPHSSLENLYIASTRRSAMKPEMTETTNPNFAVSLASAFTAATSGAAYSCFSEHHTGELKVGYRADFTTIDFAETPESLIRGQVLGTWFGGRATYSQTESSL